MSSYSCSFLFIALVVVLVLRSVAAIRHRKPITVNKCCNDNESLSENQQCILRNENDWWPLIVMVLKQSYFEPKGSAPQFMKSRQRRPSCESPEFYTGQHKLALFSNGTLYLLEKHKFIEPYNYCIDKDSAIVCDPEANSPNAIVHAKESLKIRKCCVKNSIYQASQSTCVAASENILNSANSQMALSKSTEFDVLYGFPECKISRYFTIAATFEESNLDRVTNRLMLKTGRKLEWTDFCLENVVIDNENETETAENTSVFVCADHFSIPQNTNEFAKTVIVLIFLSKVSPLVISSLYRCLLAIPNVIGYSIHFISDWIVNFRCVFVGHTCHAICSAFESSHASLALSNILCDMLIDRRSSFGIHPTIWS